MPEKDYYYLYQKYKNKYLYLKGGTRFTDIPHDLHGLAISNASSVDIIKICLKFNTRYRRDFNDRNICDRIDWRNLLRDRYNIVDYEINEQQPYPIICNNIDDIQQRNHCRKFYYITKEFHETLNRIR